LLVLASDGVTSTLSPQELISAAHRHIATSVHGAPSPRNVAERLVHEAVVVRGAKDNATALVVRLPAYSSSVPDYAELLRERRLSNLFGRPVTYGPDHLRLLLSVSSDLPSRDVFLDALFNSWDVSRRGALSRDELRAGLLAIGRRVGAAELDTLWRIITAGSGKRDVLTRELFLSRA